MSSTPPGRAPSPTPGSREPGISVSIVSHGQAGLVALLMEDLERHASSIEEVILISNIPEPLPFKVDDRPFPVIHLINSTRKGFGANHNMAFEHARHEAFCVMNPDIRLPVDPFPALLAALADDRTGLAAPLILNEQGETEDSARRFPTLASLALRAVRRRRLDYPAGAAAFSPDWVAGMFMLFRADVFAAIGGFDERFFLYYEDVDICARLRRAGRDIRLVPSAYAVHAARRRSHRSPRYARWHLSSMLRYLVGRHLLGTYD